MELKEVLNYQIDVLSELNELLDFEKDVLIKDKASELLEIIEKKKLIAKKISLLEKKRQELCGDKTSSQLIKEGLLEKVQVDKLKNLTDTIKEKGETNLALTKQSLSYIRMINSALNPNQKVVTYGNKGQIGDKSFSGLFTTTV
jgi:flagellar biosynthesis/type III secretory pathway chaperone